MITDLEESRGFGFVTMKDSYVVDQILFIKPHIIDGKAVFLF